MQTFRNIQRSPVAALIVLILLGAFLAVSAHAFDAHDDELFHTDSPCQICIWFYGAIGIISGFAFLTYLISEKYYLSSTYEVTTSRTSSTHSRAPPIR